MTAPWKSFHYHLISVLIALCGFENNPLSATPPSPCARRPIVECMWCPTILELYPRGFYCVPAVNLQRAAACAGSSAYVYRVLYQKSRSQGKITFTDSRPRTTFRLVYIRLLRNASSIARGNNSIVYLIVLMRQRMYNGIKATVAMCFRRFRQKLEIMKRDRKRESLYFVLQICAAKWFIAA